MNFKETKLKIFSSIVFGAGVFLIFQVSNMARVCNTFVSQTGEFLEYSPSYCVPIFSVYVNLLFGLFGMLLFFIIYSLFQKETPKRKDN